MSQIIGLWTMRKDLFYYIRLSKVKLWNPLRGFIIGPRIKLLVFNKIVLALLVHWDAFMVITLQVVTKILNCFSFILC